MFRRLVRHFLRGLVDNDLVSRGDDLHASIAGGLAAFMVLSAGAALTFLAKYNSVKLTPRNQFRPAQFQTLADKLSMAIDDRALLLGGAMILMALLAVIWWDALTLDDRDAAVLGPLPLRPSLVLAAKFTALFTAALVAAAALNALPAIVFPTVVFLKAPVGLLEIARDIGAHAAAGLLGCLFVFLALSCVRTVAGLFRPRGAIQWLLPLLQLALLFGILGTLFALPWLAGRTREAMQVGASWVAYCPWLWFLGVEEVLAGRASLAFAGLARTAAGALALSAVGTATAHALALRVRFHRAGSSATSGAWSRGGGIAGLLEWVAVTCFGDGRARAAFLFTIRTIARNPRHRLYLAGSLGLGLAVAAAAIVAGRGSKTMELAAQLNLIFFVVVGLRMAATVPADIDAGWTFRFLAAPARELYLSGTRAAIFFVFVLPMLILLAPVHAWRWDTYTALVHFAFGTTAALGLLEIVFTNYRRMPFVSSFVPGRTLLAPRLALYIFDYALFAYLTPVIEQLLIERTALLYAWLALLGIAVTRLAAAQSKRLQRDQLPVFDHAEADVEVLRLWDASPVRGGDASVASFDPRGQDLFQTFGAARHLRSEPTARPQRAPTPRAAWRLTTDLRHAVRRLFAHPGFTIFSVSTLALGIAATTALYSVIYSTVLKPLPVPQLDRLVNVYHSNPLRGSRPIVTFSLPDYLDFAREQHVFTLTAAHAPFAQVVVADGVGAPTRGEFVSGHYFALLGLQPLMGRLLVPADDRPGGSRVAVIDERTWRRRFNGRSDVVGQSIVMAGQAFEIVGVTPAGFGGVELPNLAPTAVWVPLAAAADIGQAQAAADREYRWLGVKGRLAPDRTVAQAKAELAVIAARLDSAVPIGVDLPPQIRIPPMIGRQWVALPAADRLVTEETDSAMRRLAWMTMVATGLVLLVACTNLSNLALARAVSRRREVAIRFALGASRRDVVREQLVEHAIVAALAAATAFVALRLIVVYGLGVTLRLGPWVAIEAQPVIDGATLAAGAIATLLSLVVAGLLPALSISRGASLTAVAASHERWSGRRLLIAWQVAVSVALVAIAGLCARHIARTATLDTGIDLDRLAFARFDFRVQGWPRERAERTLHELMERTVALSGIEAAAIVSGLPLRNSGRSAGITASDRPFTKPTDYGTAVQLVSGTPSMFRALGVSMVSGRTLLPADTAAAPAVVVLSEFAAQRAFGSIGGVGRQVLRRVNRSGTTTTETLTVVGLARDTRDEAGQRIAVAYLPLTQAYEPTATLLVRTDGDTTAASTALRALARRLDPELGVIDAGGGAQLAGHEALAFQIMGALAGTLGTAAMALAMIGLYGVLSFVVAQRTREIGIRVALGATGGRITRLVLGEGVRPVIEGLVAGFVIADLAEMAMRPALQKPLPAIDGTLLVLVPVPFLIAAVIACYLPSRRAASVDPAVVLRRE